MKTKLIFQEEKKKTMFLFCLFVCFKLQFEMERCELKTTISILKERINSLENELKLKSSKLAQTSDDSSQFKTEICSLQ